MEGCGASEVGGTVVGTVCPTAGIAAGVAPASRDESGAVMRPAVNAIVATRAMARTRDTARHLERFGTGAGTGVGRAGLVGTVPLGLGASSREGGPAGPVGAVVPGRGQSGRSGCWCWSMVFLEVDGSGPCSTVPYAAETLLNAA